MQPMLNIAIRAAIAAGEFIVRQNQRIRDMPIEKKRDNDFVTAVDKQTEKIIIDTLHKSYPRHAMLAEESGAHGNGDYLWIIDPLDGTTNYIHEFPQYAVSIALQYRGVLEQAVIYDPMRQEMFTASRGRGAQLNNRRIRTGKRKQLKGALLAAGFPAGSPDPERDYLDMLKKILPCSSNIRYNGSSSLELAYTACGRLDGIWQSGLQIWDIAAGALLIKESGGFISDSEGGEDYLQNGNVVAANPEIHQQLLALSA